MTLCRLKLSFGCEASICTGSFLRLAKGGASRHCAYTILFEKVTGLHCQIVWRCLV